MLAAVGFLATALYWPGVLAAATAPRWAVLLLIVPWLIRDGIKLSPAHFWGLVFIVLAVFSLGWTPSIPDAVGQFPVLLLWGALFLVGAQADSMRQFYIGCITGLSISSAFILVQWMGWHPVREMYPGAPPSGLFINGNYLAEAAALIAIAAIAERMWWALPILAPALIIPHARGATLALAVALAAYFWPRSRIVSLSIMAVIAVGIGWGLAAIDTDASSAERFAIWSATFKNLDFWGYGLFSFWSLYPAIDIRVAPTALPEYAHNEFLNIAFELGVPGLVAALAFCLTLAGPLNSARLVLIALFVEMCFAFPLHLPSTVAIGFLAAGHAVRGRYLLLGFYEHGRVVVGPELQLRTAISGCDLVRHGGNSGLSVRAPLPGHAAAANSA